MKKIITLISFSMILTAQTIAGDTDKNTGTWSYQDVRAALLSKHEIALLDVREEAPFAQGHPLFAANLPLSRIELEAYYRIPRRNTTIVVYDNGEGLDKKAVKRLLELGYSQVHLLKGGLQGWRSSGGEIFIDVNVPSKAFGELVESKRHTPSLSATEVKALIDTKEDIVILDARRYEEYQTMNIPGSTSVPGAELVLRARQLAPNPKTKIIVNCAGRTRSIIGTQSLINAGIPNPVVALRNGTIGWTLVGQELEHGANRRFADINPEEKAKAIKSSRKVADKAGVKRTNTQQLRNWLEETERTTYRFDVRTPEEYETGHLSGFRSYQGGQLVQETDHAAPVRRARIVLADDEDSVRANMTGSWLAQMGWEVYILDNASVADYKEKGSYKPETPPLPVIDKSKWLSPSVLAEWLSNSNTVVIDLAKEAQYVKQHIPKAWYVLRYQPEEIFKRTPEAKRYVLTSSDGNLAQYAFAEFQSRTKVPVYILQGGTKAWETEKLPLESTDVSGTDKYASPGIDRYKRPYEGTNVKREAMEAYLEWEYGLVEQLRKDGTHGFNVAEIL